MYIIALPGLRIRGWRLRKSGPRRGPRVGFSGHYSGIRARPFWVFGSVGGDQENRVLGVGRGSGSRVVTRTLPLRRTRMGVPGKR
ncbi:hypothetical protein Taro_015920 [Colocasia esculenta]|uniref:Uncharacterized protein n=1 Tax=Colocasia esculenta TaxID=4460 RepID=A0A843URD7_COLES|nr:hypothetical protein [Colocasia esculenta]